VGAYIAHYKTYSDEALFIWRNLRDGVRSGNVVHLKLSFSYAGRASLPIVSGQNVMYSASIKCRVTLASKQRI
jgi:hypothetical protein